jgi:hypothetical protein
VRCRLKPTGSQKFLVSASFVLHLSVLGRAPYSRTARASRRGASRRVVAGLTTRAVPRPHRQQLALGDAASVTQPHSQQRFMGGNQRSILTTVRPVSPALYSIIRTSFDHPVLLIDRARLRFRTETALASQRRKGPRAFTPVNSLRSFAGTYEPVGSGTLRAVGGEGGLVPLGGAGAAASWTLLAVNESRKT